jgi:hypothetical protein
VTAGAPGSSGWVVGGVGGGALSGAFAAGVVSGGAAGGVVAGSPPPPAAVAAVDGGGPTSAVLVDAVEGGEAASADETTSPGSVDPGTGTTNIADESGPAVWLDTSRSIESLAATVGAFRACVPASSDGSRPPTTGRSTGGTHETPSNENPNATR